MRIIEDIDYSRDVPGVTIVPRQSNHPDQSDHPGNHESTANSRHRANSSRRLDLFLPESDTPTPAVVVIHGGGWFTQHRKGTREQNFARDLAAAGFAAASIDYTLVDIDDPKGSNELWPAMLVDCKLAVAFLRHHANTYNIAPKRVGAIGGSAGAHLAAMLGVTGSTDGFDPAPGLDCSVQAVCYLYGVCDISRWISLSKEHRLGMDAASIMLGGSLSDRPEAYAAASPVNYLSRRTAPTLLIHGLDDDTIPYTETEYFYERMQAAGIDSELILVPGAGHSFDLNKQGDDLKSRVVGLFRDHLFEGKNA